jgi:putative transposase
VVKPAGRRQLVDFWRMTLQISQRRACGLIGMNRSVCRYPAGKGDDGKLRERLKELAENRPRFGYRRLYVLLRREGIKVNHKRVYRIYKEENLAVRRKKRKRIAGVVRQPLSIPSEPNLQWSMDFMSDALADGRKLRTLNIIDDYTRECLAIEVDTSIPSTRVVRVLERLIELRSLPQTIVMDNGPEFTGKTLDQWAFERGVALHFIEPGKPIQNALIESFNGKFRDECLNQNWFTCLADAKYKIETWRWDYNNQRPHSALNQMTPIEFAEIAAGLAQHQNQERNLNPLTNLEKLYL